MSISPAAKRPDRPYTRLVMIESRSSMKAVIHSVEHVHHGWDDDAQAATNEAFAAGGRA